MQNSPHLERLTAMLYTTLLLACDFPGSSWSFSALSLHNFHFFAFCHGFNTFIDLWNILLPPQTHSHPNSTDTDTPYIASFHPNKTVNIFLFVSPFLSNASKTFPSFPCHWACCLTLSFLLYQFIIRYWLWFTKYVKLYTSLYFPDSLQLRLVGHIYRTQTFFSNSSCILISVASWNWDWARIAWELNRISMKKLDWNKRPKGKGQVKV